MYLNLRYSPRYMHMYLLRMYGLLLLCALTRLFATSLSEVRGSTAFPSNSRVGFFPGSNPSGKIKRFSFFLPPSISFFHLLFPGFYQSNFGCKPTGRSSRAVCLTFSEVALVTRARCAPCQQQPREYSPTNNPL